MIRISLMAATATFALGAGHASAQRADNWQFQCPEAGTIVEQSSGTALRYRPGTAGPGICNVSGQQRLLGYWSMREGFYAAGGARIANAFAQGLDLGREAKVSFEYFGPNRYGISSHYQESWSAGPGGTITTPAGSFDTVRVTRDFQVVGVVFSYVQTVWFDRATRVPVQARVEHLNPIQAPTLVNWVATDIARTTSISSAR